MSTKAEEWQKKYYPTPASDIGKRASPLDLLDHSIRKWRGLSKAVLKKHGLSQAVSQLTGQWNRIESGPGRTILIVDAESCALCERYMGNGCRRCPLKIQLGRTCDDETTTELSPYAKFIKLGKNRPMLKALIAARDRLLNKKAKS